MEKKYTHTTPADIENTSMRIITEELWSMGITLPEETAPVVKRVIHATADFEYTNTLSFTPGAMEKILSCLTSGELSLVTDTNMALSGISKASLEKLGIPAFCYMADPEIASFAKEQGTTRAYCAMGKALFDSKKGPVGLIVGNAPTALIRISEEIRNGNPPAFVIGVPVGFVNVVESKEELYELCLSMGIPAIIARGRKGGSTVAAAIANACLYMATRSLDTRARGWD